MSENIRNPAVAGSFYPGNAHELINMIQQYLAEASGDKKVNQLPKAIIAPHAGYIYSGPIAANAYRQFQEEAQIINKIILLGPAHRVPLLGLAASSADHFVTPLGKIPLDKDSLKKILELPQVTTMDEAHRLEHSLEVHLPFLQQVLGEFSLVPLVVGESNPEEVAEVLETLWGGPETRFVISSDLSHYHEYHEAKEIDGKTSQAILELRPQDIEYDHACGRNPIKGMLYLAQKKGMNVHLLDLRNSGDTAGTKDQVVGYGAYVIA